jgi:hypothetical protein
MKIVLAAIVALVVAWLGLWLSNTGVLVYSADTSFAVMRDCRYFIGVSVARRMLPLAERCPVLRTLGG